MLSFKKKLLRAQCGKAFYSLFILVMMLFMSGCASERKGLQFKEASDANTFTISGKIQIPEIIETDLAGIGSVRGSLTTLSDYRKFKVTANGASAQADRDGSFSIKGVPYSEDLVLRAEANKLVFLLRVTGTELYFSDLSNVRINLKSTIEALVYEKGVEAKKDLTPGDIRAREYVDEVSALVNSLRLVAQMDPSTVSSNILKVPAVANAAKSLAQKVVARESVLIEANSVLRNIMVLKDMSLLKAYFSPSFSNDWDLTSNYEELLVEMEAYFKKYELLNLSWSILESEFLPENSARIRTRVTASLKDKVSEETLSPKTYVFDAYWRKEGSFWKLFKNFPYKVTHPAQAGADALWGEISLVIANLNAALAVENIELFEQHISKSFTNDFDKSSSYTDVISSAMTRFASMDVKVSEYAIQEITPMTSDSSYALVKCSGRVKAYNLLPGLDVESGIVNATIQWRKEDGHWKIFKNLPYKFTHKP
jgi:hypothetical protein